WTSVRCGSVPSLGASTANQYGTRRTSEPRVRRTKPVASPSVAPAVTARVSEIEAPAVTLVPDGVTVAPFSVDCCSTDTVQGAGPPPASATCNVTVLEAPVLTRPKESPVGWVNTRGLSARWRLILPPPSRVVGTSVAWPATCTGSPVDSSADLI